jgi:hypothetical protein
VAKSLILLAVSVGISPATRALKVGAPEDPAGAANTVAAVWLASTADNVPELDTGLPDTVKISGRDNATLVTVPRYVSAVRYPCDFTYAVVAIFVELSELDCVTAVAVPESATVPENVYEPAAV